MLYVSVGAAVVDMAPAETKSRGKVAVQEKAEDGRRQPRIWVSSQKRIPVVVQSVSKVHAVSIAFPMHTLHLPTR